MPKKLPKLPGLAFAIIIVLGLLCAAMALHISIIDGAEGAGPAQEIKRRHTPVALIAYLTNPADALPLPATVNVPATVNFRMEPKSDDWKLQRFANGAWECADGSFDTEYSESDDDDLGRIATAKQFFTATALYLRGVVPAQGDDACFPSNELAQVSPAIQVTFGTANPGPTPPGYGDKPPEGIDSIDTLIYQTPGGDWVAQMFVSVGAAVVIMAILRSMVGLIAGIGAMPISAYGMASIGYGAYWYVIVMVLLFVLTVAAFTVITRRPSG